MNKEERAILEKLDAAVRSPQVRPQIDAVVERVRADLARKPDALMAWEPVGLEMFSELPTSVRSGWVFVLRAGTDTGAERHPGSHQRMLTVGGTGDMKIDAKGTPNEVDEESEILWHSHVLISDSTAPVERRWVSIPKNVWHRPVIPEGVDWVVVSFHTVPADELIEERPGARQMLYLDSASGP